jgi:hypothetical protein
MHSAALIVRTEDGQPGGLIRRLQHERPVGTVLVVMLDVDPKDPLQVATANDQEPVEALGADRPDPALLRTRSPWVLAPASLAPRCPVNRTDRRSCGRTSRPDHAVRSEPVGPVHPAPAAGCGPAG